MKRVEWIILVTDRYRESKRFYKDVLGLEIIRQTDEEEFCQFRLTNCFLALYGRRFVARLIGEKFLGRAASAIYSFAQSENIDADYQQLKGKGVQFIQEPKTQPWGQKTAYFADPDGNIWEIQQWIKKQEIR